MFSILIKSVLLFSACLSLHILIWRIKPLTNYSVWLPVLFIIFIPIGGVGAFWLVQLWAIPGDNPLAPKWLEWIAIFLFQSVLSLVYMIGYTTMTTFGPSMEMIKALAEAPKGLSHEQIVAMPFFKGALSEARISNLIVSGMIKEEEGDLHLAWRGRLIAGPVLFYRHLLGLPDGGGG